MKTKLITAAATALMLTAATGMAMGPGGCGRGGPGGGMAMMDYALDLTDEQKERMQALREEYFEKDPRPAFAGKGVLMDLDPADPNYTASVESLAELAAENARQRVLRNAEMRAKMQQILTPEQLAKWREIRTDMQSRKPGRGGWK